MAHISTFKCPNKSKEKIVLLNQDIGYLLIKYLKGLDVINYMEAVNHSEQFQTIEISDEYAFYSIFMKLITGKKIKLSVPYLDFYFVTCSLDEEGYLCPNKYYTGEAPALRLFIHPTFTVEAFEKLCCTYKTPSFQCYSRLLPFNTHTYAGNLILVDYFNYNCSIGYSRNFNVHEKSLFKGLIL